MRDDGRRAPVIFSLVDLAEFTRAEDATDGRLTQKAWVVVAVVAIDVELLGRSLKGNVHALETIHEVGFEVQGFTQ